MVIFPVLLSWNYQQMYKFGRIQTSETWGQLYCDVSPYKVSEYCLSGT